MTVIQQICANNIERLKVRAAKLEEIGAPDIILNSARKALADYEAGNPKINGGCKYKNLLHAEIVSFEEKTATTGYPYKKNTVIVFETVLGTICYDDYNNRIHPSISSL